MPLAVEIQHIHRVQCAFAMLQQHSVGLRAVRASASLAVHSLFPLMHAYMPSPTQQGSCGCTTGHLHMQ